jgi:hypothetical protein
MERPRMADPQPAAETMPPVTLPPVKVEDFVAEREGFADRVWRATTIAIGAIVGLLILLAIFLL